MTKEQAVGLFTEAGFTVSSKGVTNRCGGASNPRVAFGDLNGDGRPEAHVADVDPKCYGKPGAYFAILAQQSDGTWKRLIAEDGIVGFDKARTGGWLNLLLDAKNSACPGVRQFNGKDYGTPDNCSPYHAAVTQKPQPAGRSATAGPVSQKHLFDWDGSQMPEAKALPVSQRNAIFKAAGVQQLRNGKWTGCPDDPSGNSEAMLVFYKDINADGVPEAMVQDSGTFCNGHAGVNSTVLRKTPSGGWAVMVTTQGFANFLVSRGAENYPDIEVGLPGFCFPYLRWNRTEYAHAAQLDDKGKPCKPF